MSNAWDMFRDALAEYRAVDFARKKFANDMAAALVDNLRAGAVSGYHLTRFKRELRGWNMHTETWND